MLLEIDIRKLHLREVRHIGQKIEDGTNAEAERPGNLKGPDRILDIVEDVIDIRPAGVSIQYFERRRGVLKMEKMRYTAVVARRGLTSLLLCELPTNAFLKFTCGSSILVWPDSTTQPENLCYLPFLTDKRADAYQ